MRDIQFVHTYKFHNGKKKPVICTAMKIDKDAAGKPIGLAVGFAYCSKTDNPNKKVGRMIAIGRVEKALTTVNQLRTNLNRQQFSSDAEFEQAKLTIATTYRTRYGQNKTELDDNKEPYQTGHPHFSYIPLPVNEQVFNYLEIPDDKDVESRIVFALSSIEKFGQL